MYKRNEVEKQALEYFGDALVANVWMDKYALKTGEDDFLERSPNDTIVRMATEFARIEKRYQNSINYNIIYNLLKGYEKFVLGGSPLFGIGNNLTLSTLGSCFVIDSPVDSYGGIFKSDQELAQLMKRRGGVGVDLSTLRPNKTSVNNAAQNSTGGVSFAHRFSNTTREVAQDGRRGALMLTMLISYPDIEEFITCKDDLTKITGANISVKITDNFMLAVKNEDDFTLHWNDVKSKDIKPIRIKVKAKKIWDKLIHQAWKTAEPGVLFWDNIIKESPADCYSGFKTLTTNPCSELPLCAYDSCRLGSINTYAYIINPFSPNSVFDYTTLAHDTQIYQRLMDDLIELEKEKIQKIIDKIINDPESDDIKKVELTVWNNILDKLLLGRRTGLGQMGLADAGAALGLKYGSDDFIEFSEKVSKTIAINSYISSIKLAKERGSFIGWDSFLEMNNPFLQRIRRELPRDIMEIYMTYGRRNIANLTIAPTGSISMLAKVSSGIEPVFALSYNRKRKVTEDNPNKTTQDKQGDWWEEYEVFHPKFKEYVEVISNASAPANELSNNDIDAWDKESPYANSTAHDIDPYTKLKLQSRIQPWIDHSISVTYNLPSNVTEQEVSNIYFKAWELGLKGLTVYRDGCRDGILTTNKASKLNQYDAPKRPKDLPCDVYNIKAKGQDWKVFIGLMDDLPYEVFAVNGAMEKVPIDSGILRKMSSGTYNFLSPEGEVVRENITEHMTPDEEALTRCISWALRHGSKLQFGVEQLNKSKGDVTSFSKAISRTLKRYIKDGVVRVGNCPDCGSMLVSEGGCFVCKECLYSKCN